MLISTADALTQLAPLLKRGKLVLVAGSGISIPPPSNLPSWDDLLKGFIEFCQKEVAPVLPAGDDFIDVLLDAEKERSRNPIRVASVLKRKVLDKELTKKYRLNNSFLRWMTRVFAPARPNANHLAIVRTNYPFILTSNYDDLFSQAATEAGFPRLGGRALSYQESDQIAAAVYEEEPCIIHLHGRYEDASLDQIVFTAEDYLRIKHDHKAFAVVVQSLLLRFSTLFVGYGASDPHLEDLLEELIHLFRGGEPSSHPQTFLLLHRDKATKVFVKYKHSFRTDIIAVDDYAETPIFLEQLSKEGLRT
ncbi:MAG: SIR2 family protein [Thermoanaerobaculia bacterium]